MSTESDAEIWYPAPPISKRFRDQDVVQNLLAEERLTLGAFGRSALVQYPATRKRSHAQKDKLGTDC